MAKTTRRGTNNPNRGVPTDGYRSKFEASIASQLKSGGIAFGYEVEALKYVLPAKRYLPDFTLSASRLIIEVKGWFKPSDRTKMLAVKRDNPDRDIRLLFQRANTKLSSESTTTYAEWAEDHGFPWAEGVIPTSWLEPVKK